jgi:hypothetical protein
MSAAPLADGARLLSSVDRVGCQSHAVGNDERVGVGGPADGSIKWSSAASQPPIQGGQQAGRCTCWAFALVTNSRQLLLGLVQQPLGIEGGDLEDDLQDRRSAGCSADTTRVRVSQGVLCTPKVRPLTGATGVHTGCGRHTGSSPVLPASGATDCAKRRLAVTLFELVETRAIWFRCMPSCLATRSRNWLPETRSQVVWVMPATSQISHAVGREMGLAARLFRGHR